MSAEMIPTTYRPHPLSDVARKQIEFPLGVTLHEMLTGLGIQHLEVRVLVGDEVIERDRWSSYSLTDPSRIVVLMVVPDGVEAVFFAIVAAINFITPYVVTFVVTAAVSLVANLAYNALVPPQDNEAPGAALPSQSPTLTGAQNRAYPYTALWRAFGQTRLTFPLAAKSFTEAVGGDLYLNMLMTAGYGPLDFSEWRIGNTFLSDYDDVELQYFDGEKTWRLNPGTPARGRWHPAVPASLVEIPAITLFKDDVITESPAIPFITPTFGNDAQEPSDWTERSTEINTEEISVDLTFTSGLFTPSTHDSRPRLLTVAFDVQIKTFGADDSLYVNAVLSSPGAHASVVSTGLSVSAAITQGFVTGFKIKTGISGHDTIRIRRRSTKRLDLTDFKGDTRIANATWTAFRSIRAFDFTSMPDVTLIALRLKSSDQLNGVVSEFSAIVKAKLRPYLGVGAIGADVDGWGAYEITSNAAWAYLHVLTGPETRKPLPLSRIDLVRIMAWAELNYSFDYIVDFRATQHQLLQTIAGVARGSYTTRDGKHSVVVDVPQSSPLQLLTPRNSWGYSGRRRYIELPHALRINFQNAAQDYQVDEVIVYDDGYTLETATEFETLTAYGLTSAEAAWSYGRYMQRVARYRQENHEITVDVENLVVERGDRVILAHDVPLAGTRFGRITANVIDEANFIVAIELDEEVVLEDLVQYAVVIRWIDATSATRLSTHSLIQAGAGLGVVSGPARRLDFSPAFVNDIDHAWQVGDLVTFGVQGVATIDAIVHRVKHGPDLTATLFLTDYAGDQIFAGETPPALGSLINSPLYPSPALPTILDVRSSGDNVLVIFQAGALAAGRAVTARIQVQHRTAALPAGAWIEAAQALPISGRAEFFLPVSAYYDIRIRAIAASGTSSSFVTWYGFLHELNLVLARDMVLTGFEVKGRGDDTAWIGRDLELSWRPTTGAAGYRVTVLSADGTIRRQETVGDPRYNYSLARNQDDELRLSSGERAFGTRSVQIKLSALDSIGDESPPLLRSITNLAPEEPTILASAVALGISINWGAAADPDATKILVWRGATSDFVASTESLIYGGTDNPFIITTRGVTDQWYRFARADEFSESPEQLNVSATHKIEDFGLIQEGDIQPGAVTSLVAYEDETVHAYQTNSDWELDTPWRYITAFTDFPVLIPAGKQVRISLSVLVSTVSGVQTDRLFFIEVSLYGSASGNPWSTFDTPSIRVSNVRLYRAERGSPSQQASETQAVHSVILYPPTPPLVDTIYKFAMDFRRPTGGEFTDAHLRFSNVFVDFLLLKR